MSPNAAATSRTRETGSVRTGRGSASSAAAWRSSAPAIASKPSKSASKALASSGSRTPPDCLRTASTARAGPPSVSKWVAVADSWAMRAGSEIASPLRPCAPPEPFHDSNTSCSPRWTPVDNPRRWAVARPTSQAAAANWRATRVPVVSSINAIRIQASRLPPATAGRNVAKRSRGSATFVRARRLRPP